MTDRHDLAEIDSSTDELDGDDALFRSLLLGAHVENAALSAGVSVRTAYRRLADPRFRRQLDTARESLRESILNRLSDAAGDAISRLWELLDDEDPRVQLQAAKTLLDSLVKVNSIAGRSSTTVKYSVQETRET